MSPEQYYDLDVMFEIIHQLKYRELFLLPYKDNKAGIPVRWLNAQFVNMLMRHLKKFGFYKRNMNMYHSLAQYKDFPTFSYNWNLKSQQQKVWNNVYHQRIIAYDLFLETDSMNIEESYRDAKKIKEYLDTFKISYSVKFSGSKGYHFIVRYEDFSHLPVITFNKELHKNILFNREFMSRFPADINDLHKFADLVILMKVIAIRIGIITGCTTMDTTVQDVKRVIKLAYSFDVKSGNIAYPLTDLEFDSFTKNMVKPENVRIRKRGLLWRHPELSISQRQENVNSMIKDLLIY